MQTEPRILILDADAQQGARLMGELRNAADPIESTWVSGVQQAREALAAGAYQAVVVDMDVPDLGLGEFLESMRRERPELPVFMTAARIDNAKVTMACKVRAAGVLPKPADSAIIHRSLHAPAGSAGFVGTCRGVSTVRLLALCCASGEDGVLHLVTGGNDGGPRRVGCIHLEHGQPVHAATESAAGPDAVHDILSWRDAISTWMPGQTGCPRTIVGRWEGLLARPSIDGEGRGGSIEGLSASEGAIGIAFPDVVEKLSRLAQTPDVLGAFLLRHAEIVTGRCESHLDHNLAGRSLCRLAHVYHDVHAQPGEENAGEIQAIVGGLRLVLDRVGPPEAGFHVGVVVRQASPICKSLRRLLRQIDRAFRRAVKNAATDHAHVGHRHVA